MSTAPAPLPLAQADWWAKSKRYFFALLLLAIGGLIGFSFGLIAVRNLQEGVAQLPSALNQFTAVILTVLALLLALIVAFIIHELGHLLAGLMLGFKFLYANFGPFRFQQRQEKWTWVQSRMGWWAGFSVAILPDRIEFSKGRLITQVAAGPIASLLLGGLSIFLLYQGGLANQIHRGVGAGPFFLGCFVAFLGFISLLIGMATLLPSHSDGFYSDGSRLLNLLNNQEESEAAQLFTHLTINSALGARPRELNAMLLFKLEGIESHSLYKYYSLFYSYYHRMDTGQALRALNYMNIVVNNAAMVLPVMVRRAYLEIAFFNAWINNDPTTARQFYKYVGDARQFEPMTFARVEAAILLAEGNAAAAAQRAGQGLHELEFALDLGMAKLEQDWLEDIGRLAVQRMAN